VSSVSGGSITAGRLALSWGALAFDGNGVAAQFGSELVEPIRSLASRTIDRGAILKGPHHVLANLEPALGLQR
jgi:NTE family protein